jgi:hypothetical protein
MKTFAMFVASPRLATLPAAKPLQTLVCLALAALVAGVGCTHTLEVKNLNSYRSASIVSLKKPTTIGMVQTAESPECQRLVKAVGQALGKNSAQVLLPYTPAPDRPVDVVAEINITPEYKGSGWNFLINWPGFLVFVPALNGYVYKANYQVDIALAKSANLAQKDAWTMPINLDLRHAEIDRTWTEIGWFEWGVIPLIGGIVFTQYDPDVTPILIDAIETPVGDYIAQEIIQRINASETLNGTSNEVPESKPGIVGGPVR